MKTITVQIGNSDDKLTQKEWGAFVADTRETIERFAREVHFFGAPSNYAMWQNAAWVFTVDDDYIELIASLKKELADIREHYQQESIAWTEGQTVFV